MRTQQIWIGEAFHPEKINPISTSKRMINKPDGGLWTSQYTETKGEEYLGDWHKYISTEYRESSRDRSKYGIFRLEIDYDMDRLYTIDSYEDLEFLIKLCPLKHEHMDIIRGQLDFEKIFQHHDVIHMTEQGQWKTRLTEPYNLYGWDTECWLWNNTVNIVDIEILSKVLT